MHPRLPEVAPTPGVVGEPRDAAARLGDVGHQLIGGAEAEHRGDVVLLLEQEPVERPPCPPVQLDAHIGQQLGCRLEGREVDVVVEERETGCDGVQDVDVAKAPVTLLQVGLEEEGDVALVDVTFVHLLGEGVEPLRALGPPEVDGIADDGLGDLVLTPDDPGVEEPEGDAQVARCCFEHLLRPANAVVEMHPWSHTGYQMASATLATSPRPVWTSTTSRSLKGQSSPRP